MPVAKHGNRAVTSQCGSADVLVALGINIEVRGNRGGMHPRYRDRFSVRPNLHPAMKHVAGVRREWASALFLICWAH